MTASANATFSSVGIEDIKVKLTTPQSEYQLGRDSRIAGLAYNYSASRDWQRGWAVVDYALNHPSPEAT